MVDKDYPLDSLEILIVRLTLHILLVRSVLVVVRLWRLLLLRGIVPLLLLARHALRSSSATSRSLLHKVHLGILLPVATAHIQLLLQRIVAHLLHLLLLLQHGVLLHHVVRIGCKLLHVHLRKSSI